MAQKLKLLPYTKLNQFKSNHVQPISHDQIKPVHLLCPSTFTCTTATCNPRSLLQSTKDRDISHTKLIIGNTTHNAVPVLTGKCSICNTYYAADYGRFLDSSDITSTTWKQLYTNDAKYLKVGQNLWVDRSFSKAILNGMFSFHASSQAYTQFWNNSFGLTTNAITLQHVWQTFVQESVRTVAAESSYSLELLDNLPISDVAEKAFDILGENGSIHAATQHSCSECSHPYKKLVVDPPINSMDIDEGPPSSEIKMVVLDGIVMGPTVSLNIIYIYIFS